MADEDIHRGHMERVTADEQRMERQRKAQALVLHAAGGMGIDRLVGAQQGKGRQDLDQISQLVHRPTAKVFEAEPIATLAVGQKLVIASQITGRQARHFGPHRLGRLAGGKGAAIFPADFIKRVQCPQIDIAIKIAPTGGPKLTQALRHGDDGRPQIKAVAALGNRTAPPAGHVQPVDHRYLIALGPKAHGGRKATQPGTNDNSTRARRGGRGGGGGVDPDLHAPRIYCPFQFTTHS